jgi:REP element-mobilizing transposase RayT
MPNTFSQIYLHILIVVSGRHSSIHNDWKNDLYKYITGIVHSKSQKLIMINGISNHLHMLLSTKPNYCISDLVRDIKSNSSRFINQNEWANGKFSWQSGSGIFSVSQSQLHKVKNYIMNQEEHHKEKLFKDEFEELLKAYQIPYQQEFLFDQD